MESPRPDYTEFTLNQTLVNSNDRLSQVLDNVHNNEYLGNLSINEAIKIIEEEMQIQKEAYFDYKTLPPEMKTNLQIAEKFSTIEKYWFAFEESLILSMSKQIVQ